MKKEFDIKFYNNVKRILKGPFKLVFNPKVIGIENIPNKPYILAGNHKSFLDIPFLIVSLPDDIHFMAKSELFDSRILNYVFSKMGSFPINRDEFDLNAIKKALKILKSENVLGMFPEGTRNKTDDIILPFKNGVSTLAVKTNSLIVPFGISGEYQFRKNLRLNIGEPIDINNIEKENQNEYIEEKVKQLILK